MKKSLLPVFLFLCFSWILIISGCSLSTTSEAFQENTPLPAMTLPLNSTSIENNNNDPLTIAEVEGLAGFDIREPAYLPAGVSFDFATYQDSPTPIAILHFKIVHETYGDMGSFFQITQEPKTDAPPDTISCGKTVEGCEVLSMGDMQVVYHLNPAGPEGLDWYEDGFAFRLLRTAGEPNKVYKEELVHVVASMK